MDAPREKILVVDDDENTLALFRRILDTEGYEVITASAVEQALTRLEANWFDLVITDLRMPRMDGLAFLERIRALSPSLPCIVLTAYGTVESAVVAMKGGAYDYLTKPVDNEKLRLTVKNALELHRLTREIERLRAQVTTESHFENIVGRSKAMRRLFGLIKLVGPSQTTILIQGESGTGKELIARATHAISPRRDRPFIALDCAMPETLLESELFGHVRGAFTGAIRNKKGLFEEAHGGTLLLDEVGDTTLAFQSKLLRALQEGEVRPVGSGKTVRVDVRVIVATNKDLKKAVENRTFREDLYYRLAVIPILIPPLRERQEDIPLLADHFVKKYCAANGLEPKLISVKALKRLIDYPWRGNVRELEHVIERAVLMSPDRTITPDSLLLETRESDTTPEPLDRLTRAARETVERDKIVETMQKAGGNRSRAARLLGISRATLYNKLRLYHLADRPDQS